MPIDMELRVILEDPQLSLCFFGMVWRR